MIDILLTEEQKLFRKTLRELGEREILPFALDWDENNEQRERVKQKWREMGIYGLMVPEKYGGVEGKIIDLVILCEEMSRCGAIVPLTHISASCRAIAFFGSEEIKQRYLPDMTAGLRLGAYASSEPSGGSDLSRIRTFAKVVGDHYVLNGSKCFITNAQDADLFVTLAKTDLEAKGTRGISVFLVERDTEGLSIGKNENKQGRNQSTMNDVFLEECRIPQENLLIPAGDGFKKMMSEFNVERCGNASNCVGTAQGAFERALEYSKQREAFGHRISDFQGMQWMLADMYTQIDASRTLVFRAAYKGDKGYRIVKESAMAKLYANEMVINVTNNAMQIHGGYGYLKDYVVERFARDARGLAMAGGTTQILRNRMAYELLR
jgi:alkylation response protein AidB-like acyl-CoA dehydrogenase